jgi:ceramide synthetase
MLGERAFRFINYTGRTPVLFYILLSSDFLDLNLGGTVERPLYFKNYPCQPLPPYLDDFYVFKISFHLYELFNTLAFGRARVDFLEYVLHHLMTWALIHFSYALNYIPIGAVIMLIHDVTDIPVTTIKLITDITNKNIELIVFIFMFTSWLYLRLWFFPFKVIYRMVEECYHQAVPGMNYSVLNMMLAFLCGLVCLHIFWVSLMIKGALKRTSKSQ